MDSDQSSESARIVHEALIDYLRSDEILISWTIVMEVASPIANHRYLGYRHGGGSDGTDAPTTWAVIGMLQAALDAARDQLRERTVDTDDNEDDES